MKIYFEPEAVIKNGIYSAKVVAIKKDHHQSIVFYFQVEAGNSVRVLKKSYFPPFTKDGGLRRDVSKLLTWKGGNQPVPDSLDTTMLLNVRCRIMLTLGTDGFFRIGIVSPEHPAAGKSREGKAKAPAPNSSADTQQKDGSLEL